EDGIRDRNVTGVQTCALPIWFHGRMLHLRAVLPFNDGPFTLRRFRLVLEHREEPRRATAGVVPSVLPTAPPRSPGGGLLRRLRPPGLEHSALFVHCGGGFVVEQHIRRPTTSRGTDSWFGPCAVRPLPHRERVAPRPVPVGVRGLTVIGRHPARIDVERPGAPLQHLPRNRAG